MNCPRAQEDPGADRRRRFLIDAGAGAGLLLALAVVFAAGIGRSGPGPAAVAPPETLEPDRPLASSPRRKGPLRLAVTPKEFDDVGKLLDTLGEGYRWEAVSFDDLLYADVLAGYDVVFFTCGRVPPDWAARGIAARLGGDLRRTRPDVRRRLADGLRQYVAQGGTLYASDWRFTALALAFPEQADADPGPLGAVQKVEADVLDPGLQRRLGRTIELAFDKIAWYPAAFHGPDATAYLRGRFKTTRGGLRTAPLLVQFPHGSGTVIFTSFHNEAQHSETELELLRCLVFASVLAREEGNARRSMVRGGFSPVEGNLLTASAGDQSFTETYRAEKPGDLQFVLAFEGAGARLRLRVEGPDGRVFEQAGDSTLTIDVPAAPAGPWKYTITPLKVPYRNFPFSLTVGQKEQRGAARGG